MNARLFINRNHLALIVVLHAAMWKRCFGGTTSHSMTTGRRYATRTKDNRAEQVLDARTKAILHAVSSEPRGRALTSYLRIFAGGTR
jgi:hypothetical protein